MADAVEGAVDTEFVVVRGELVVDEVEAVELETVGADDEEVLVTAPRKHEANVAPEVDNTYTVGKKVVSGGS